MCILQYIVMQLGMYLYNAAHIHTHVYGRDVYTYNTHMIHTTSRCPRDKPTLFLWSQKRSWAPASPCKSFTRACCDMREHCVQSFRLSRSRVPRLCGASRTSCRTPRNTRQNMESQHNSTMKTGQN